nr:M20/M25/M40 family metallo-hydrolase [Brenneria tiliae]
METGVVSQLESAQEIYCTHAISFGLEKIAQLSGRGNADIPLSVREKYCSLGEVFFTNQPSIVLGAGQWEDRDNTIMFNFHMDTVGPILPVKIQNGVISGRGVIDNKGPGVAVLSAIKYWLENKENNDNTGVLIQAVGGEEGGAMGTYGSKILFEKGYYGTLNLFVIPSEAKYYDCSTTSMTVEFTVNGNGTTDDSPWAGHNATLILSYLTVMLSKELASELNKYKVKMTVAGIHTGEMHNRVYGSGKMLINFSYHSIEDGVIIEELLEGGVTKAKRYFKKQFGLLELFRVSAGDIEQILSYRWLKKGLPVLKNRNVTFEDMLAKVGIVRHVNEKQTFTCDAMWGQREDCYSIMYGPGSLELNGAHTAEEEISIEQLESFSQTILRLLDEFSQSRNKL